MALILNLETATKTCSVALGLDGNILEIEEITAEKFSHAEKLNLFIEAVLDRSGKSINQLDAVAISAGPGSYTGLRIGTSSAKGICYALDIPLISVNSLKALASLQQEAEGFICPMFDARRMEVYAAVYNSDLENLSPTEAVIIEESSFAEWLRTDSVTFLGPGAEKCMELLDHENAKFDLNTQVSAKGMASLTEAKFQKGEFEDLAYFEPAYLKDFVAGKPKKLF